MTDGLDDDCEFDVFNKCSTKHRFGSLYERSTGTFRKNVMRSDAMFIASDELMMSAELPTAVGPSAEAHKCKSSPMCIAATSV